MAKYLWKRGRYNEAKVLCKEVVKSYEGNEQHADGRDRRTIREK
jgi:hypothetical protein